ncbi:hypothetical protein Fmac_009148 [Flemingia macrophylla]|uniref:Guanylate-binding protein/Atlastin C-terminal domain-containing protein n=1 Tax=Flemingia macrophylla TaxID=520843 RepID=A0ABD1N0K8_9FABA
MSRAPSPPIPSRPRTQSHPRQRPWEPPLEPLPQRHRRQHKPFWSSTSFPVAPPHPLSRRDRHLRATATATLESHLESHSHSDVGDNANLWPLTCIPVVAMREAHEQAVQKSMAAFNPGAVGVGSARKKYEDLLQKFFKKEFEDYRRNAFMEADLKCSNAIQSMEKRLRAACNASDAKIDNVTKAFAGRSSLTQAIPVQKKREITEEELQLEPLCNEGGGEMSSANPLAPSLQIIPKL